MEIADAVMFDGSLVLHEVEMGPLGDVPNKEFEKLARFGRGKRTHASEAGLRGSKTSCGEVSSLK